MNGLSVQTGMDLRIHGDRLDESAGMMPRIKALMSQTTTSTGCRVKHLHFLSHLTSQPPYRSNDCPHLSPKKMSHSKSNYLRSY